MRTICVIWVIVVFFVMFQIVETIFRRRLGGWRSGKLTLLVLLVAGGIADGKPVILNPSFEVDAFYNANNYGYNGQSNPEAVTGWLGGRGVASALTAFSPASPFADNGKIPDGNKAVFIQHPGTLSQTIGGFKTNNQYRVVFYENARRYDTSTGDKSYLQVLVQDQQTQQTQIIVSNHQVIAVQSAGSYTTPYTLVSSGIFTATSEIMTLIFQKTGNGTALIDNVQIQTVTGSDVTNAPVTLYGSFNSAVQYVPATPTLASQKQNLLALSPYCNLAWIENYDEAVVPPLGLTPSSTNASSLIDYATSLGMKSVVAITYLFFDTDLNLYPNWQQRWNNYSSNFLSRATNIAAFSTMDEPYARASAASNSIPGFSLNTFLTNLAVVNSFIKSSKGGAFSNIPIAVCFDAPSLSDTPTFPFVMPDGFDWVGISAYPVLQGGSYDHYLGKTVPALYSRLKSYMKPGQRIMYVPEAMLGNSLDTNSIRFDVLNNYDRTMYLAQNDPLSVAVVPYVCFDDYASYGFRNVPWLLKKVTETGKMIKSPGNNGVVLTPQYTTSTPSSTSNGGSAFDNNTSTWWDSGVYASSRPQLQADYGQTLQANTVRIISHNQGAVYHDVWVGSDWYALNKISTIRTDGQTQIVDVTIPSTNNMVRFVVVQANPTDSTVSETVQWTEIQLIAGNMPQLTIANSSFEEPALASPGAYSTIIPSWTTSVGTVVQNLSGQGWVSSLPAGNQVAVLQYNDSISQTLPITLAAGYYNLSAYIAGRSGYTTPFPFHLQLYAGTTLLSEVVGTAANGVFARYCTYYTSAPNDTNLGAQLKIVFNASVGENYAAYRQTLLDGVQVNFSATLPPPATITSLVKSGSNLVMVWSGGTNNNCVLLSSTNIAQPMTSWSPVATNVVLSDGRSTNTVLINVGQKNRFYRLSAPY